MTKKTARKTVDVGSLLYRLNYFLANDKGTVDEREAMCSLVEGILHDTGNYKGYRYLAVEGTTYIEDAARRFYFVSSQIVEDYNAAKDLAANY